MRNYYYKIVMVVISLSILLGCVSGCSNQKELKEETIKNEEEKENENEEKVLVEMDDGETTIEEMQEEMQYNAIDTTNYQPYSEYQDIFPKYIESQYMPKCHSYFLGDPYTDGNIVYKLTISTGCIGEYRIKLRLEKVKVQKTVSEGNYVKTETAEGEYKDVFETNEEIRYDNSICPNVAVAYDTQFNEPEELHYIDCYMATGVGERGNFYNGYEIPIIDQIIYNPGTSIENYRTFYSFEDFYGYDKYIHMDTSKVNSEDIIVIDTNIEPFASEINGKEFKADWNIDVGRVDELADPIQLPDIVNGYDYGYKYDDEYSKPSFYDTLLY